MQLDRRRFLVHGCNAGLAVGLAGSLHGPTWAGAALTRVLRPTRAGGRLALEILSAVTYQAWIGQTFALDDARAGGAELTLCEVRTQPRVSVGDQWLEQYSIEFSGPADPQLAQGIWRLRAPTGLLELFLVPVGRHGDTHRYEAVFSRFVTEQAEG